MPPEYLPQFAEALSGPGGPLKFWNDQNSPTDDGSTFRVYESYVDGINVVKASSKTEKVLRNGRIYILRDGKTYTTSGIEVK